MSFGLTDTDKPVVKTDQLKVKVELPPHDPEDKNMTCD